MTAPIITPYPNTEFEKRLHRMQRQRDMALRGYERNRMSPELAEALRSEIRKALDADGKPFDVVVAQRVYDLAIAAKDMCVAATAGVGETIKTLANNGGPIESLGELEPGAPAVQAQASETFGARIMRELMAALKPPKQTEDAGQLVLVHALAAARRSGMTDVAEALEVKLFGAVLTGPRPIAPAIEDEADERVPMPRDFAASIINEPITTPHKFEARTTDRFPGPIHETCEHCGKDPRNTIHKLDEVEATGPKFPRPPSGAENAFDNGVEIV